jgi:hypothetical protein
MNAGAPGPQPHESRTCHQHVRRAGTCSEEPARIRTMLRIDPLCATPAPAEPVALPRAKAQAPASRRTADPAPLDPRASTSEWHVPVRLKAQAGRRGRTADHCRALAPVSRLHLGDRDSARSLLDRRFRLRMDNTVHRHEACAQSTRSSFTDCRFGRGSGRLIAVDAGAAGPRPGRERRYVGDRVVDRAGKREWGERRPRLSHPFSPARVRVADVEADDAC